MAEGTDRKKGADEYLAAAMEKVRGKLLDTTRRNRLLNYRESGRDIAIIDEMPDQVHKHLVVNANSFTLDPFEVEEEDGSRSDGLGQEPSRVLPVSVSGSDAVEN